MARCVELCDYSDASNTSIFDNFGDIFLCVYMLIGLPSTKG